MPQTFDQVYGLYRDMLANKVIPEGQSLRAFSARANDLTGSNEFDEGQANGTFGQAIRKGSYWVDQGINATGLPDYTGEAGSKLYDYFGADPQKGYDVGHGLPRGVADFASFFVPGLGEANGLRMGVAAGMTAAHTFGETGQALPSLISGASVPLMGAAGEGAVSLLAKTPLVNPIVKSIQALTRSGNPAAGMIEQTFLEGTKDKALSFAASQIGALATGELTNYATSALAQHTWNPYEGQTFKDWALGTAVSQLPWLGSQLKGHFAPKQVQIGERFIPSDKTPSRPDAIDPTTISDNDARLRQMDVARSQALVDTQSITDPEARSRAQQNVLDNDLLRRSVINGDLPGDANIDWAPDIRVLKDYLDVETQKRKGELPTEVQPELENQPINQDLSNQVIDHLSASSNPSVKDLMAKFNLSSDQVYKVVDDLVRNKIVRDPKMVKDYVTSDVRTEEVHRTNDLQQAAENLKQVGHTEGETVEGVNKLSSEADMLAKFDKHVSRLFGQPGEQYNDLKIQLMKTAMAKPGVKPEEAIRDVAVGLRNYLVEKVKEKTRSGTAVSPAKRMIWKIENMFKPNERGELQFSGTTLGKDGTIPRQTFDSKVGRNVSKDELTLWKEYAPDLFEGDKVNVKELISRLKEIEAVKLTELRMSDTAKNQEKALVQHELDTRFPGWQERAQSLNFSSPEEHQLYMRYEDATRNDVVDLNSNDNRSATARYGINPYPDEVLKGQKEVAPGHKIVWAGDLSLNTPVKPPYTETLKFASQHYTGDEADNQLAFVRGAIHEFEPGSRLPNGEVATKLERIMEVFEVQSDWAGKVAEERKSKESYGTNPPSWVKEWKDNGTSLLSAWEPLAIKHAIDFAREQGATKIIVSDGKSAMMTEGHDRVNGNSSEMPKQAAGMTAAYDQRIPNLLKKLTGSEPTKVDLGVHKAALTHVNRFNEEYLRDQIKQDLVDGKLTQEQYKEKLRQINETGQLLSPSPVFKDGDKPKTNNTGRMFDLKNAPEEFSLFSLKGKEGEGVHAANSSDQMVPPKSVEESVKELLRLKGLNESEQRFYGKYLTKVYDMFSIPDLKMGALHNDFNNQQFSGLAEGKNRFTWIDASKYNDYVKDADIRELAAVIAHENFHVIERAIQDKAAPKEVLKANEVLRKWIDTDVEGAYKFLSDWRQELPEKFRDNVALDGMFLSDIAKRPEELYATMGALWAAHRLPAVEEQMFHSVSPQPVRSWVKEISKYASKVLSSLKQFITGKTETQPHFRDLVNTVNETFDVTVRSIQKVEKSLEDFDTYMSKGSQDLYNIKMSDVVQSDGSLALNPLIKTERDVGRFKSALDDAIRPAYNLAENIPVFKRAMTAMFKHAPMIAAFANKAMGHLYAGRHQDGSIRTNGVEAKMYRATHRDVDEKLNRFTSDVMEWMQHEGATSMKQDAQGNWGFDVQKMLADKPTWPNFGTSKKNLADTYNALTDEKKQAFLHTINASHRMHKDIGQSNIKTYEDVGATDAKFYLANAIDKAKWPQVDYLARGMFDSLNKSLDPDLAMKQTAGRELEILRRQIGDDTVFNTVINMWSEIKNGSAEMQKFYDASPQHMSMMMRGKYQVRAYTKNSKGEREHETISHFDDLKDVAQWRENVRKEGFTDFTEPVLSEENKSFKLNDESLGIITRLEQRRADRINSLQIPEDIRQILLDSTTIAGEIARQRASKDITLSAGQKGLTGGERRMVRSDTRDMVATQRMYAEYAARTNATKIMRAQIAHELTNPELSKFPEDVQKLKRHLENYMRPDSDLSKAITGLNAKFYLAGNFAGMATELGQPFMTIFPEVVNRGHSPFKALKIVSKAAKDMALYSGRLLKAKIGLGDESKALGMLPNKDEGELLQWLSDNGYRTFGYLSEIMDQNASAAIDLNKNVQTGKGFNPITKAGSVINNFANEMLKAYSSVQYHTTALSALAGYRIAKERMGKNFDKELAFNEARDFMWSTTYSGGRANRTLLHGDLGPVGAMAYSLSTYTLGWLNQMGRYMMHWKGSDYIDLSQEQRKNARNAAVTMFGTQLAAAGALGIPFVGAALKLLGQATDRDLKGELAANLAKLLDEDDADGGGFANVVMNGAANGLMANAGLPIDVGKRMGVDAVLGLNSYDGFNGDAVFGPTAGIVSNTLAGLKSLSDGDFVNAAKSVTPNGLRKMVKLALDGGDIKTSDGKTVQAGNVEKAAYALGFNPQSLTALQNYKSSENAQHQLDAASSNRDVSDILAALDKDPSEAQAILQSKVQRDAGSTKTETLARQVAKAAADRALPLDIRRTVGGKSGQHLLEVARALGVSLPEANQVVRSQYVNNVLQLLGQAPIRATRDTNRRNGQNDALGDQWTPFQ